MNRHLHQQPQRQLQHQLLQRQSLQQRQQRYRACQLEQQHLQVKTVDRKELVEHYLQVQRLRSLVQQGRHLDHLEPTVPVVQQEQVALLVQRVQPGQAQVLEQQVLEEPLALEEPPAELVELDPVRHLLQN
jgi:hypothetical protein